VYYVVVYALVVHHTLIQGMQHQHHRYLDQDPTRYFEILVMSYAVVLLDLTSLLT
jgi:hypothetical protein